VSDSDDQPLETFEAVLEALFARDEAENGEEPSSPALGESTWTFRERGEGLAYDWSEGEDGDDPVETLTRDDEVVPQCIERFFEGAQTTNGGLDLLDVETELDDGEPRTTVEPAGNTVGFVGLDLVEGVSHALDGVAEEVGDVESALDAWEAGPDDRQVQLQVVPKIEGADWASLLALSRDWSEVSWSGEALADYDDVGFSHLLAAAYDAALGELFDEYGGLKQSHSRVEAELEGQIQGQLQVGDYLGNVAQGQVATVPCEYSELSLDNWPNRTLLWGLHLAQLLVRDGPSGEHDLWNRLHRRRRHFADVERQRVRPPDLAKVEPHQLPGAFRGYEASGALELARFLIKEVHLDESRGSLETRGLHVDMADVFETAFARQVADEVEAAFDDVQQERWDFLLRADEKRGEVDAEFGSHVRPDVYLGSSHASVDRPVVADTKWKNVAESGDEALELSISASDLQQIATYAHVASMSGEGARAVGYLVYPCDDETFDGDSDEPPVFRIEWEHAPENHDELELYAIFWRVDGADDAPSLGESAKGVVGEMVS
jgi:hypothetical protein